MPAAHVNGAELYYEVRGHGPSLLLIAGGEQTAPVMREMAERLVDRLRDELLIVPGGHLGYLENPAEVAAAIRPFLEGASSSLWLESSPNQ